MLADVGETLPHLVQVSRAFSFHQIISLKNSKRSALNCEFLLHSDPFVSTATGPTRFTMPRLREQSLDDDGLMEYQMSNTDISSPIAHRS